VCGIAGVYFRKPEEESWPRNDNLELFINSLLTGIETRGRDATGILSVSEDSEVKLEKADIPASMFVRWRRPVIENPQMILLHTRAHTKGDPRNLNNNHPVQYDTTYVTHNGVIVNDDELFSETGLKRYAEVDTEIIPALLSQKGIDKAHLALQELQGGFAIAACDPVRFPNTLLLAKGSQNPLEYVVFPSAIVWASTRDVIREAYKELYNKELEHKYFNSLGYGGILLAENSDYEILKFQPKESYRSTSHGSQSSWHGHDWEGRPWNRSGSTTTGTTKDEYMEYTDSNTRVVCECGHSKYWHHSAAMNCQCLKADCECERFKYSHYVNQQKPSEDKKREEDKKPPEIPNNSSRVVVVWDQDGTRTTYRACDGCGHVDEEDDMEEIGGYFICPDCNIEADDNDQDDDAEDDDVVVALYEERPMYGRSDWLNDPVVCAVAKEHGCKPGYIGWLLFELEDSDYKTDQLINAYVLANETYQEKLEELRSRGVVDDEGKPHQKSFEESALES